MSLDRVKVQGTLVWVHADVLIQGVRVRISAPSGEELAKALAVMGECLMITPVAVSGPLGGELGGWRYFNEVVPFREQSGAILWTTRVPDWAVYDRLRMQWRMPTPEEFVGVAPGPDQSPVCAPQPTWRDKPPLL